MNLKKLGLITTAAMLSNIALASYVAPPQPITKGGTGVTSQSNNKAVTTDGSGHVVSTSSTTATEIGYVAGVTSSIQSQFGGKASTALDNIAAVALSADLICATSGSCKLGSAAKPFGDSYLNLLKDASGNKIIDLLGRGLYNSSNSKVLDFSSTFVAVPDFHLTGSSSGYVDLIAPAAVTSYSLVFPAAQGAAGQYLKNDGSGNLSWQSPASMSWSVVDGGDADYTILAGDQHVRTSTTLTAGHAYTLPACISGNVGERHEVKNTPDQTFLISVTADGSDLIDGEATFDLSPGDSVQVICGVAATWDIE